MLASPFPSKETVMSLHNATGGILSLTVIVCMHVFELFVLSVALHVLVIDPVYPPQPLKLERKYILAGRGLPTMMLICS